ncbi:MAG: hypothetical protein QOJ51_4496 [Acidobacteriaceae bacterium]|nr:hypothetical protein [Acidobacteriaceae bacterium]
MIQRILLGALCVGLLCSRGQAAAGPLEQVGLNQYTQELDRLRTVAEGCAQELAHSDAASGRCDPSLVGPDVAVSITNGKRTVSFEWLREALGLAASAEAANNKQSAEKDAAGELSDARSRLAEMIREQASPPASVFVPGNVSNIRRKLDGILESGDYPPAEAPSWLRRMWGDFVRWLLNSIVKAMPSGSSPSAIYLLELTVIAVPCGLLIWWFIRRLQMQKLGLSGESAPHTSAPSAQGWQVWLEQGQTLGREGRWREAIHHVYWAAISCLESRRLWPADRTRTPREYLGLLSGNPETRAELSSLTRSFEHTWYGERQASEKDFAEACGILERIAAR